MGKILLVLMTLLAISIAGAELNVSFAPQAFAQSNNASAQDDPMRRTYRGAAEDGPYKEWDEKRRADAKEQMNQKQRENATKQGKYLNYQ